MAAIILTPDAAIAAGLAMGEAGADIIDVGGESTRPGLRRPQPRSEQARILPVIRGLAARRALRVSVDTRHASTMAAALDAGAAIVNDVSALCPRPRCRRAGCRARLSGRADAHARRPRPPCTPKPHYDDVVQDVPRELAERIAAADRAGIAADRIAIDPGIGFAKTRRTVDGTASPPAGTCPRSAARSSSACRANPSWRTVTGEAEPRRRLPARSPRACSPCRAARPSCACTTWRKPFRRSGSGGYICLNAGNASIAAAAQANMPPISKHGRRAR